MGEKRSYGQYCTVARALDVVGERWTLLLVRELSTGPKRFKDLLEGAAWDRNQPPRRQAQSARGRGARPARHVASACGVERLRADGTWGVS